MPEAPRSVRIQEKIDAVTRLWTPHKIATFDGHQIVVARVDGEFVWHDHADHDEVFLPLTGTLLMDFEGDVTRRVEPGELIVVPKGTRHRPRTEDGEVTMLVLDPLDVKHTGGVESDLTVDEYPDLT